MKTMKFCDVPIGAKVRFKKVGVIYTRVEHTDEKGKALLGRLLKPRTLTYQDEGETRNAFCALDSETMVEVIEEKEN